MKELDGPLKKMFQLPFVHQEIKHSRGIDCGQNKHITELAS